MLYGFDNKYPYTDFHELNLDWILRQIRELNISMETFVNINTIKYADPILWDITTQYEQNTLVQDNDGVTYLSKTAVPAGISINNTDYWLKVADFTQLADVIKESIARADDGSSTTSTANRAEDELVWLNNYLYKVIRTINAGDAYVFTGVNPNVQSVSVEEVLNTILGIIKDSIARADDGSSTTSTANRAEDELVWLNNYLYKVIRTINAGDAYVFTGVNPNVQNITIEELIDAVNQGGVIKESIARLDEGNNITATVNTNKGDWLWLNDKLYDALSAINIGDTYDSTGATPNIESISVEEKYKELKNNDNIITPEEFGAIGDGVTDDTQSIQDCLLYAHDNKKVVLLTREYYVTDKIHIYSKTTIISEGGGIVYNFSYPNVGDYTQYFLFDMNDEYDINIDGISFTGRGAVTDNYDISYVIGGNNCSSVNITNCSFLNDAGLACIQFHASSYITILNCHIKDYTYCGIGFSEACKHVTVQNCVVRDGHFTGHVGNRVRYAIVLSGYGTAYDGNPRPLAENVKAINNFISDSEGFWEGIDCHGGTSIQIRDNVVLGCGVPCAVFSNPSQGFSVNGAEISGNYFSCVEANNSQYSQASTMGAYIGTLINVHDNVFINSPTASTVYRGIKLEGDNIHFDDNILLNVGSHSLILGSDYRTTNSYIRNNLIRMNTSLGLTGSCIYVAGDTSPIANVYINFEGNTFDVSELYEVVAGRTNSNTQILLISNNYYVYPTISVFTGLYPDIATPATIANTLGINNWSVRNVAPTAGGYIGWVRISGVWKGYGTIQS